ncbi:MAG: acetyl-CoA carboxylase biotin carboxyl carrier protein [Bacteroidia bacterium]|nr:acetyl-CoA carboxylase biotin carboxyl carrier protein [Bacteroidia bacterium]
MDLQYVKRLIKIVNESEIAEIEIEEDGKRVRITRAVAAQAVLPAVQHVAAAAPSVSPVPTGQAEIPPAAPQPAVAGSYHEVRSPIVGTFYRSSSPDADPYVQVGQNVTAGDTLCIIEAMKIMNDIESDISGRVVKVLVENGQAVEYNQPLFLIDPS